MARAFNAISAKPAFSNLRESINQSEYLNKKKGLLVYCNGNSCCNKIKRVDSYALINAYNNAVRYIYSLKNGSFYNKNNLIASQYSKLNLKNICASVPSMPEYSNSDYLSSNKTCVYCNNTNIALNNTKINVDSDGQYTDPSGNVIPFYQGNTIDPEGQLFGNSQCGELNFTLYMIPGI